MEWAVFRVYTATEWMEDRINISKSFVIVVQKSRYPFKYVSVREGSPKLKYDFSNIDNMQTFQNSVYFY